MQKKKEPTKKGNTCEATRTTKQKKKRKKKKTRIGKTDNCGQLSRVNIEEQQ